VAPNSHQATAAHNRGQEREAFGGEQHLTLDPFGGVQQFRMTLHDRRAQPPLEMGQPAEQFQTHVLADFGMVVADRANPAFGASRGKRVASTGRNNAMM